MNSQDVDLLCETLDECLKSTKHGPLEEPNSLGDAVAVLGREMGRVASAISPTGAMPGTDATGGHVSSLTEAMMGITAGLVRIAESISDLADAVRDGTSHPECFHEPKIDLFGSAFTPDEAVALFADPVDPETRPA